MIGSFFPSKVQPLTLTAPVPLSLRGNSVISVSGSLIWYITANSVASPGVFTARVTNPLGPGNPGVNILFCTGNGDATAAAYGHFVKVTPNASRFPTSYPPKPFWFNTAQLMDLYEDVNSGLRMIVLGTDSASDMFLVDETLASLNAAINAAAASKSQDTLVNVTPLGTTQGTATRVPIVRGQGNYTIFIGGISSPAANGIRLEMVAEDGTTVIPPVIGTEVTIYNNAILQTFVNVYPQSGGSINGAGVDIPYVLDRSGIFTLICTAANVWAIKNNEFGKIEADTIYQNNTAARLGLGDPAGQGVFIDALGAAPVQLAIRDPAIGLTVNSGTTQLQGIQNGDPAFTLASGSTFHFGGVSAGQEGKITSLALSVVATDPPVVVSPAAVINITSATGAAPGIRFDGSAGMLTLVNNGSAGNATVTTDGGTVFATLAAAESGLVMSSDNGTSWGLVATFPIAP